MSEKVMTKKVVIYWKRLENPSTYNFEEPVEWGFNAGQTLNGKFWTIEVDGRIDYVDLDEARHVVVFKAGATVSS